MSNFKDFLEERDVITILMSWYGISLEDNEVKDFIYKMIEYVSETDSSETDQSLNLDMMAKSYEKLIPHSQRKTMGEFFTPIHIVDYILKSIGYTDQQDIENKKLIDLSCGSGSFLTRAVNIFVDNANHMPNHAAMIINKVKEKIFGIDINPIACILCQINIYFMLFKKFAVFFEKNKEYNLPIFNIYNEDTFQYIFRRKYDYVVGNPPYLFIRAIHHDYRCLIENLPLKTNKGQYDYYQIFIELGINILKENGKLGYIVPDTLLALSNRKILRKFIYEMTRIKEIYYSGPQFDDPVVSNIILILERESDKSKRINNEITLKFPLSHHPSENKIIQNLIEGWDYEFLINIKECDIRILHHLSTNFPKLIDLIENPDFNIKLSRGVELGKEGEVVYCENCSKNYPLPNKELKCPECQFDLNKNSIERIILEEIPHGLESNFKPFLYSMNQYIVTELKYIDTTKNGINYKDLEIYKDRIVIRQINQDNMICATYDKNSITSQSYYNLKIKDSSNLEFSNEYILGLLNSNLLSYYFIKSFGSYKKLFPRILIEKLKALPIKVPSTKIEKNIAEKLSESIHKMLIYVKENKDVNKDFQQNSDNLVYELYSITNDDRDYITNFIKNLKK